MVGRLDNYYNEPGIPTSTTFQSSKSKIMKTLILISACSLSLNLFSQVDSTHEKIIPDDKGYQDQTQNLELDTSKNCLTLRNGKVIIMQNGKESELKQDTTFANGTKIKINGTIIKKSGTKMTMKAGECFTMEGIRMTNAGDKKKTAMNK